ncbi:hypothetical protein HDZ31DRAFT_65748 [Schizophyllum fasciatum]
MLLGASLLCIRSKSNIPSSVLLHPTIVDRSIPRKPLHILIRQSHRGLHILLRNPTRRMLRMIHHLFFLPPLTAPRCKEYPPFMFNDAARHNMPPTSGHPLLPTLQPFEKSIAPMTFAPWSVLFLHDEGLASGPHPSGPPTEEEMSRRAHDLLAGLTQEREGRRREVRTGAVGARGRTNAHLHAPQSWLPLHDGALPHAREEIERRREEVLDAHHRAHDEAQRREAEQQRERQSMMEMDRRRQEDIKRRQEETDRHRQGPSPDDARYPTASASSHLPHRPAAVSGVEAQRKRDAMRQANLRQAACRGGKEARRKWAEEKRQKEERSQRLLAEHLARMEEEARQRRALDAEQQRLQAQDRLRQAELDAANAQGRLQNGSSDPLGDALAAAARLADRMQAGELAFRSGPTNITVETQQQAAAHFIPPRGERLDDAPGPVKARRKTGTKRRARGNTKATETSSSAAADWTDAPVWFVPTAGFVKRPPPSDLVESVREKRTTTPLSRTPVPHLEPATWPIFDILDSTAPVDLAEDAVIATSANEPHHDPTAPSYPSAGQSYPPTDCATTSLLPGALNPGLRGEASQDDVVPSLVPVSQRAYVVPAEYSIEHTFAARLRACPVCEEKEDCEDEGHVEAECVHGKKFEKCKRCIELGLDGKARWKTRCVAQEGVVRHRVWSRSSLSEGVREQVIAAAADEASEDEACELGCSEEHPLKQDVGVGPPMANPVIEDPQTMHPLEDSNSDEDIQITGHVLPRSASPPVTAFNDAFAPLHSAISIARRYLPTDCTLAMQDGTLIPVPRASLSGSVLVVPSPNLPAFAPSDPSHGDLQAQIELTDERSAKRSRKRSRGSAAPASSLQAKRARSRSPTSQIAANDGDDTAAAQALMLLFSSNAPSDPAAQPSAEDSAFASTALRSTADEATETGDDVTITPSDEDRDPVTIAKDEVVGPATAPSLVDAGVCEPPRADIEWTVDVHVNASAISETDRCADEPLRIAVDATTDTAPTKVDEGTSVDSQARVLRLLRWARSVTAEQRRICLPQPDIESHLMETLPDLPPPTSHSPEAADILSEGRDTYEEAKPHEHDALLASIATEEALAGPAPAKESAPGIIAEERKSERKSTDSIEDELSMTTAVPIASNSPAAEPARGQTCAAHDVCDPQPALICAPTSAEAVAEELFPEECPSVVEPEASSLSSAPAESEERPCTRVLPTPRVELPDSPISPQDPLSAIALTPTDDRLGHLGAIATTKAPTATEATVKISPPAGVPEPSSTPLTDNERPPPQATGFAGSLENGYARACATGCPPNDQRLVKQDGMILPAGELQPPRLRLSLREHLALKRKREAEEAERDGKRARADSPPSAPPLIPVALMTGGGSRPRNSRSPPPQRLNGFFRGVAKRAMPPTGTGLTILDHGGHRVVVPTPESYDEALDLCQRYFTSYAAHRHIVLHTRELDISPGEPIEVGAEAWSVVKDRVNIFEVAVHVTADEEDAHMAEASVSSSSDSDSPERGRRGEPRLDRLFELFVDFFSRKPAARSTLK